MEQEPADKLRRFQFHNFLFVRIGIIAPDKEDFPVLHLDDTMISDSNPVRISSQIIDECLSVFKRRLGIDNPFRLVQVIEQNSRLVLEFGNSTWELQLSFFPALF